MSKPEEHPMFPEFKKYAIEHGINMDYECDWIDWWRCYEAGVMDSAHAMGEALRKGFTVDVDEEIPH